MSPKLPAGLRAVLAEPTWPNSVERPRPAGRVGLDYDTAWTRTGPARRARTAIGVGVLDPLTHLIAKPKVLGLEHVEGLEAPVIFAANHTSHLDTGIVLSALPPGLRRRTIVAAAADTFFDRRWKAAVSSFVLGAIPVERTRVNRRSADLAAELLGEGWNLVIFPEGGRSPDGWGQEFRGGAAYLARRCRAPVVPVHLHGVRAIFPKGSHRLRPGSVEVRFGAPLRPEGADEHGREEDARRFARRIERHVAALADEAQSDWWAARRRAASGDTPSLRGPEASGWRRSWALPEHARQSDGVPKDGRRPWS